MGIFLSLLRYKVTTTSWRNPITMAGFLAYLPRPKGVRKVLQKGTKVQVLKFEDGPSSRPRKKKTSKFLLPAALLLSLGMFGSTFAANISINSGTSLEFGQGVLSAAACDSEISIAPSATFDNDATSPTFRFGGFTLSGVDDQDCVGKLLTIRGYNNTDDTALALGSSSGGFSFSTVAMTWASQGSITPNDGYTIERVGSSSSSVTVSIGTTTLQAGDVYKMTVESSGS